MRTAPDISCRIIHNGIDTDHFRPADRAPGNRIPQLVAVSRLVECKGIHHLLTALARLQESGQPFNLRIVGDGDYRAELERMSHRLGLKNRVVFAGYVPYSELPELYQQADAFVLPSLTESFGQVFAEAMACGLPVVGTTAGGIPELVGPEQASWLVEPGDVDALTEKLSTVLQSPQRRQQMGARNAIYIRNRFSWAQVASEHIALYEELIQQKRNAHADPRQEVGFRAGSELDFSSRLS
jgi:glycosyltransferase involved in cell wall biosynthesis